MNIEKMVHDNLDNAKEGGFFDAGEQLHKATPLDIVYDLQAYASDIEEIDDENLILPHVLTWLEKNPDCKP